VPPTEDIWSADGSPNQSLVYAEMVYTGTAGDPMIENVTTFQATVSSQQRR
jgi:hypothetical protein